MRTVVDHSVMFLLDDDEGDVVSVGSSEPISPPAYARLGGVTVHLHGDGRTRVSAGGIRCRKNGEPDKRMGKTITSVVLPDEDAWVEKARTIVRESQA